MINLTSLFKFNNFIEPFLKYIFFFLLLLNNLPFNKILKPKIPYFLKTKVFKNLLKFFKIYLSPLGILLKPFQTKKVKKEISLYKKVYKKDKKYCLFRKVIILKKLCLITFK